MKAEELRIGNNVNVFVEKINETFTNGVVTSITSEFIYLNGIKIPTEKIVPIQLTEEWLLKLGFSDKDYLTGYIGIDYKSGSFTSDFVLTKPKILGDFQNHYTWQYKAGNVPYLNQIEFVHELQNFFHAITGQELKTAV